MKFVLPALAYPYDAFEPYLDAQTMEIHHTKHHQAYIDQLNAMIEKNVSIQSHSLEFLLKTSNEYSAEVRAVIRNHGGGHYNHSFFWQQMGLQGEKKPIGVVAQAIEHSFKSYDACKLQFEQAARSVFGSGWAWLCYTTDGTFVITTTPNQESPLLYDLYPVMGLDVWEHAYYLKYQNRRVDYIAAWWHIVDWQKIELLYQAGKSGKSFLSVVQ